MSNLVGKTGIIKLAPNMPTGPGKVSVTVSGTDELFFAWARDYLPVGSKVVIIDQLDTNAVSVEPI
jgi:hypothetical protein